MKPLTVYIMRPDNQVEKLDELMESFGDVVERFVMLPDRNLEEAVKDCKTEWFAYMFSNEYLTKGFKDVLPEMLEPRYNVNVWVLFERSGVCGDFKYGTSPRLFKSGIQLQGMLPIVDDISTIQRSLDGFVER